jgi:hypothetical protein
MGAPEIRAYLSHLSIEKSVAASTQNVALSALLVLYKQVLAVDVPYIDNIERARRPSLNKGGRVVQSPLDTRA